MKYLLKGYFRTNQCFEGDTGRVWFHMEYNTLEEAKEALVERQCSYKELSIEEIKES